MKIHLVDGTYELFRAFYGQLSRGARDGVEPVPDEVGAARGLGRSLLGLLGEVGVTHVGVAFDHVIESFRNGLFSGYKTADGVPEVLLRQFPLAEELTRALGIVVWPMVELEADDALATMAKRAAADPRVEEVLLCTPDKDLAQCVEGERVLLWDRLRQKRYDDAGVREKWGVPPASIPDLLALVGDDADGIPGLPRFGLKSAAAVLAKFSHLEDIPDDPAAWGAGIRGVAGLVDSLRTGRGDAMLYRTLATLKTDAPLSEGIDDLAWRGPDPTALVALATRVHDPGLADAVRAVQARKSLAEAIA